MASRATSDCLRLSSRCPPSSDGSPPDPISWVGIHMVCPRAHSISNANSTLLRLLWRAYQVVQTPNETLVDKLGLDIPPAPDLILEEIQSREVRIAWKQPELPNSIHKHVIHINGKNGLFAQPVAGVATDAILQLGRPNDQKLRLRYSISYLGLYMTSVCSQ
jgi:hypothetical protein